MRGKPPFHPTGEFQKRPERRRATAEKASQVLSEEERAKLREFFGDNPKPLEQIDLALEAYAKHLLQRDLTPTDNEYRDALATLRGQAFKLYETYGSMDARLQDRLRHDLESY